MEQNKQGAWSGRIVGIDALKLLAMFYIVVLHVLGRGGVISHAAGLSHTLAWALEIWAFCAVDIYALVSGFVGYRESGGGVSTAPLVKRWLQVLFWSVSIGVLVWALRPGRVSLGELGVCFLPLSTNRYWYFTAYAPLVIIAPLINYAVRAMSERDAYTALVVLAVAFSGVSTAFKGIDPFHVHSGYSVLWLAFLYFGGATMKKLELGRKIPTSHLVMAALVAFTCTICWKLGMRSRVFSLASIKVDETNLITYTSPTVLTVAVCHVILFARMRLSSRASAIVEALVPAAFGVYLIHAHPMVFKHVLSGRFAFIGTLSPLLVAPATLGCAAAIFLACLLVEKTRLMLAKRLTSQKPKA